MFEISSSRTSDINVLIVGTAHGNEPAGSEALNQLLQLFQQEKLKLKQGTITVIPTMNPCGKKLGIRYQPQELLSVLRATRSDLNRNFKEDGTCDVSKKVAEIAKHKTLVIDLHEGWGFHQLQPESMGSAVYPTDHKLSKQIADEIVKTVNKGIPVSKKQFVVEKEQKPVVGSLRKFCEDSDIPYILIETTGQNNIQPLSTRANQHLQMVLEALRQIQLV
jgi:predicted deacylase